MKKVLIALCAIIVVAVGAVMYTNGILDTRFWSYDKSMYSEFYNGTHVGGVDLPAGTYVVDIKGGSKDTGSVHIWKANKDEQDDIFWIRKGDKSFQFTVANGDRIEINADVGREMRIKKVS